MMKFLLLIAAFALSAYAGDTSVVGAYVDEVSGLIDNKIGALGVTLITIASGIVAWKNASWAPLAWGAAADILIAGATDFGAKMAGLVFA
ncbi:hypothetical protein ACXWTF_13185 [Thiomicrolovo sp. ZZH C-3]